MDDRQALNMGLLKKFKNWYDEDETPPQTKPSVGSNILKGINTALQFLNTGSGQKLSALAFKDPYVRQNLVNKGEETEQQSRQDEALKKQAYAQKMGIAGQYLGHQADIEAENIRQKNLFGQQKEMAKTDADVKADVKAVDEGKAKSQRVFENQQKLQAQAEKERSTVGKFFGSKVVAPIYFETEEDALKSGLPKGTKLNIAGRPAIME